MINFLALNRLFSKASRGMCSLRIKKGVTLYSFRRKMESPVQHPSAKYQIVIDEYYETENQLERSYRHKLKNNEK